MFQKRDFAVSVNINVDVQLMFYSELLLVMSLNLINTKALLGIRFFFRLIIDESVLVE